jgi:hypothetical protein
MRYSSTLAALAAAVLFHETTAQDPLNLAIYGLDFRTPKNAPIYRFESTLIIPPPSPSSPDKHLAAIWPGIQSKDLLQNVLTNQRIGGSRPGEWNLLPFFCCHPAGNFSREYEVSPGDALSTQYIWDKLNNKYVDSWSLVIGSEGFKAGKKGFTGGTVYDQKLATSDKDSEPPEQYHQASLSIELQGQGVWNWGPVIWRNIIIMAKTTEQAWCNEPKSKDFKYNMTTPVATTDNGITTCYIAKVVMQEPTDNRLGFKPGGPNAARDIEAGEKDDTPEIAFSWRERKERDRKRRAKSETADTVFDTTSGYLSFPHVLHG